MDAQLAELMDMVDQKKMGRPNLEGGDASVKDDDGMNLPRLYIKDLKERHHRILILALEGKTNVEIADELNMDIGHVGVVRRSPVFKIEFARLSAKAEGRVLTLKQRLNLAKHKAFDVLENHLERKTELLVPAEQRIQADVAKSFVNRTNEIPEQTVHEERKIVAHLTGKEIKEMQERLTGAVVPMEHGSSWDDIIDIEAQSEEEDDGISEEQLPEICGD